MTDIAVIILTKNEKLHIGRCLERLRDLNTRQIFVVDCFSDDGTQAIVQDFVADKIKQVRPDPASVQTAYIVVEHEWPGLYAKQFNWALDNLPIEARWVLRMDADEYF